MNKPVISTTCLTVLSLSILSACSTGGSDRDAETEANLFLARYPDADLEAELAALANP